MNLIQLLRRRHNEPAPEEEATTTEMIEDIKGQERERKELKEIQRRLKQQLDIIKQSKGIL